MSTHSAIFECTFTPYSDKQEFYISFGNSYRIAQFWMCIMSRKNIVSCSPLRIKTMCYSKCLQQSWFTTAIFSDNLPIKRVPNLYLLVLRTRSVPRSKELGQIRFVTHIISHFFYSYIYIFSLHFHSARFCHQHSVNLLLHGFFCVLIKVITDNI